MWGIADLPYTTQLALQYLWLANQYDTLCSLASQVRHLLRVIEGAEVGAATEHRIRLAQLHRKLPYTLALHPTLLTKK